jgi:RNA polymerase sigma factor (sigma-70 family)
MKVSKNYSDEELLIAIRTKQGIDGAINFIYQQYYKGLEYHVVSNSGTKDDAQDVIQEVLVVFIDLVQQGKYRGESSIKSFLYTLTRNMWITDLRKRASTQKRNEVFETSKNKIDEDITILLGHHESQKAVISFFASMGEKCKQVLTMFYYDELPIKEILELTDYENEQVLRNKKYKCLKELTEAIKKSPVLYNNIKEALQYGK